MKKKAALLAITGVLTLAACSQSATEKPDETVNKVTTGAVTFVKPSPVMATVKNAKGEVVTNYDKLAPGKYTVVFSRPGYVNSDAIEFTTTVGQTRTVTAPALAKVQVPKPDPVKDPSVYYINSAGKVVAVPADKLKEAGKNFVFYAWLQDVKNAGVNPLAPATGAAPTAEERKEVAPLGTQNLMAAFVGYKADDGKVYPVVGAGVRWDIFEDKSQTNVRFATADDGAIAGAKPLAINDSAMSAVSFTNRASATNNARFPTSAEYPTNNLTGVGSPDLDGFTWAAVWVPNSQAGAATISAVAEINGTEINKTVLNKRFAPSAKLSITKGTSQEKGLNQDGSFNITVSNTGNGPATNIKLTDRLKGDGEAAYSISAPVGGTIVGDSGFDATFDLAPGASKTFTFPARANAVGVYCDIANIASFDNGEFGLVTPAAGELQAEACLTVKAPKLTITKSLVDANGAPIASAEVAPNQEVSVKITIDNKGNADATNVVVTDRLISGDAGKHSITAPTGSTPTGDDGFTGAAITIKAGESKDYTFKAKANADGTYCDQGSFTATSNNAAVLNGTSQQVCFKVVSPVLNISKVNTKLDGSPIGNLYPGSSYNSKITVTNTGTGNATNVVIQDIIGKLTGGNNALQYSSGSYVVTGTTASTPLVASGDTAKTNSITLAPNQTATITLTTKVPAGTQNGEYCNVASFTSGNAGTKEAKACVQVVSYISVQTEMVDDKDPVVVGSPTAGADTFMLTSVFSVEPQSNEGLNNNVVQFYFGDNTPRAIKAGIFNIKTTEIYLDPSPVRNDKTGEITSDHTNGSSVKLVEGTDYTVNGAIGQQKITLTANKAILPNGAFFFRHTLNAPNTTQPGNYYSSYELSGKGISSGGSISGVANETTTVIGQ